MSEAIKDVWIPWTEEVRKIPYDSREVKLNGKTKKIGSGEERLASIFGAEIGGQNQSYDLSVGDKKFEVKELDSAASSRIGVEIKKEYNKEKPRLFIFFSNLGELPNLLVGDDEIKRFCLDIYDLGCLAFERVKYSFYRYNRPEFFIEENFYEKERDELKKICANLGLKLSGNKDALIKRIYNPIDVDFSKGNTKTQLYDGICKNEIGGSNFENLMKLISIIKVRYGHYETEITMKTIELLSSIDGSKKSYSMVEAYKRLEIEGVSRKQLIKMLGGEKYYNICLFLVKMQGINELEDVKVKTDKILKNYFTDIQLIIVDRDKGYMLVSIDKITCNRITSGCPRLCVSGIA